MNCRICDSGDTDLVYDLPHGKWFRCLYCGSDSSTTRYADVVYDTDYIQSHHGCSTRAQLTEQLTNNVNAFGLFRAPEKSFLDIGCCCGTAMIEMDRRGWEAHGFDVIPAARTCDTIQIAPKFAANLFRRRFGAVLCREVIEHVDDWRDLLAQMRQVTVPQGILQIQTPRPWNEPHGIPYQNAHLQLFSPLALQYELQRSGFEVLHREFWAMGQMYVCRCR